MKGFEEYLFLIKERIDQIPNELIYFSMKEWGCERIYDQTVEYVKTCVAIDDFRIPVTARLVSHFTGKMENTIRSTLHSLGDKRVLTLHGFGNERGQLMWSVNKSFRKTVRLDKEIKTI